MNSHHLFSRWVLAVIPKLRELPNGDGAFAALSMAFGLYERFIDSRLHRMKETASPKNFMEAAARDLEITTKAAKRFWNGFRLGMQHAFQPKAYIEREGGGDRWGWEIAEGNGYHKYPEILEKEHRLFIIKLDPWKFLDHVVQRWEENPDLMNELSEFQLGMIRTPQKTAPPTYEASPNIHIQGQPACNATTYQHPTTGTFLKRT